MKKILFFIIVSALISGCLKDDPYSDYADTQPLIIIPNSNWPGNAQPIEDSLLNGTLTKDTLYLYAQVSWHTTLDTEIRVAFQKDNSLIDAYNNNWFTNYVVLPDNCYQTPSLTISIPAHTQRVAVPIILFPDKIDNTQQYMLAFTITDAQGKTIPSTFKSMLFPMTVQ
jgi:hypothetical protein